MPVRAGTVYVDVVPNTTAFASQLKAQITPAAAAAGTSISSAMTKAGARLSSVGKSLTRHVSLPLIGIGAVATKMALDYDKAFTQIAATTNASAKQVAGWREEVMTLAGETARAPQELAEGLYFLASAGLKTTQIMPTLEASAKAAASGLGETADIARLTAASLNAYAKEGLTATEVTDTLAAAVREGTADPAEFAVAMGRVLSIASKAGVEFDDLTGSLAGLSNVGVDVNEGVTAMTSLITGLTAPTAQTTETMKELGLSADEVRASLAEDGLLATFDLLNEAADGQIDVLQDLIPNVRALRGYFGLTQQEADKLAESMERVADSKGALDDTFKTTRQSDAFKFDKAMNSLRIAAIQLGNEIIPILVDTVLPAIQDAVKWFGDLSPEAKELGIKLAGLAIVAGPLLSLVGGFLKLGGAFGKLAGGAISLSKAFLGLGSSTAAVTGPGGVGPIAGLAAKAVGPLALLAITVHDLYGAFRAFQEDGILGGLTAELEGWGAQVAGVVPGVKPVLDVGRSVLDLFGETPSEKFVAGVEELNDRFASGAITADELRVAIRNLANELDVGISSEGIDTIVETGSAMNRVTGILKAQPHLLGAHEKKVVDNYIAHGRWNLALDLVQDNLRQQRRGLNNVKGPLEENVRNTGRAAVNERRLAKARRQGRQEIEETTRGLKNLGSSQKRSADEAAIYTQKQKAAAGATKDTGKEADTSKGKVDNYGDSLNRIPKSKSTKITADTSQAVGAVQSFLNLVPSVINVAVNAIGSAAGAIGPSEHGSYIPGAQGGGFVKRPQLIRVGEHHKPEMILPLEDERGARALQTAMERALRAVMADGRGGGGGDARLEVRGFHGVNLRFQQDQDWAYSQWGW